MVLDSSNRIIGNRYRVIDEIGHGGMGTVYRVHDHLSNQTIVLKQVLVEAQNLDFARRDLDDDNDSEGNFYRALAREFQLLASLRHPNIISVLDYGFDEDNQPYFTMDLLENATTLVDSAVDQPLRMRIDLLLQTSQALEYLHRREILHRDLKPENVLVVNKQVKMLDFGLAISQDIHNKKDIYPIGTLAYLAPEVLQERITSVASDLYAFGVMAYQILSGKFPYPGLQNVAELINQILRFEPDLKPICEINPNLIPIFESLLAKDAKKRYHNATDLIRDLCKASGHPLPAETIAIRESFLQTAKFVGREEEMTIMRQTIKDKMEYGRACAWLVAGESGVGKSRLLDEVRTMAQVAGMTVLRGACSAGSGKPYELWRPIMRRLCLAVKLSDLEASVLKPLVSDIERLIQREVEDALEVDASAAKERLINTIVKVLQRYDKPLMLICEDLHWAKESLDVLNRVTQLADGSSFVVLANYRDDQRPDLPDDLKHMQVMKLPRLKHDEVARLSKQILGDSGEHPRLVDLLIRETEGNALFLVEVMRALANLYGGHLGDINLEYLPDKVQTGNIKRLLEARIERVSPEQQTYLGMAALIGREIDVAIMDALMRGQSLDTWLSACMDASILEVREERWRFTHEKIRETLELNLDDAERVAMSQEIAITLETVHADEPQWYPKLVQLWHDVGDLRKEIHYRNLAAKQALLSGANREALHHYQQILSLKDQVIFSDEEYADYLFGIGCAYGSLALVPESTAYIETALALKGRPMPTSRLGAIVRLVQLLFEQYLRRLGWYTPTAKNEEEASHLRRLFDYYESAFRSYFVSDKILSLLICTLEMTNLSERAKSVAQTARAFCSLGIVAALVPLQKASDFYMQESLNLLHETDDLKTRPWVYVRTMNYLISKGRLVEAEQYADKSMAYLDQIGDDVLLGDKLVMNAYRLHFMGQLDASLAEYDQIIKITNRTEYISHRAVGLTGRAMNMIFQGQAHEALTLAQQALALSDEGSDQIGQVNAFGVLSSLYLRLGLIDALCDLFNERFENIIMKSNPAIYMMYPGYIHTAVAVLAMLNKVEGHHKTVWEKRRKQIFAKVNRFAGLFPIAKRAQYRFEGWYACSQGDFRRGFQFFEKALSHPESREMLISTAWTHFHYGRYLADVDSSKAKHHRQQALVLFDRVGAREAIEAIH